MEVLAVTCPQCHSSRVYRDGLRYSGSGEPIQRYLCRECSFRFSDSNVKVNVFRKLGKTLNSRSDLLNRVITDSDFSLKKQFNDSSLAVRKDVTSHKLTVIGKRLNGFSSYNSNYQIGVLSKKAKNLAPSATKIIVASVGRQEVKGNLTVYMVKATQLGLSDATIEHNVESIVWLSKRTDLTDPVKVWHCIDNQKTWASGTKQHAASAYKNYAKLLKIPIPEDLNFNKWVLTGRLPDYIPTENEIMSLIASYNPKGATFLQLLYECGLRSGEAWRLKWENFDFEKKTLMLNAENCEKKGVPRQFKISDKLVAMLNILKLKRPTNPYVWNNGVKSLDSFRCNFIGKRKQLARKLQNPNLLRIKLHTFRHFYACKLYHDTKDILLVQSRLGHRNIENTMVYTRLVDWDQPNQWIVRRPQTNKEEDELIEAGFEYIRFDDKLGTPVYRKRK